MRQSLAVSFLALFKLNDKSVMAVLIGITEKQSVDLAIGDDFLN